jgi:AraC-like DNA-binding protein
LQRFDGGGIVNLKWECDRAELGYERSPVLAFNRLRIDRYQARVLKTTTGVVDIPEGAGVLWLNFKGAYLMRRLMSHKISVIPAQSATFMRGSAKAVLQAAKGEHYSEVTSWPTTAMSYLDAWLDQRSPIEGKPKRTTGSKPFHPALNQALARYEAGKAGGELAEPLIASAMFEIVARLVVGEDEFRLAGVPLDLPTTIFDLTKRVRKDPSLPWPLKEAADIAGYSPFHFSRVFKSLAGFGFHEYVDRCRTESAIEMLCNTDEPIDTVAALTGFGTTQGLRESVKEYLGLVPSEIRAVPETVRD